ncbi:MAG TPA: PspC domain-containing protein [Gaiellaceae bacterium]|nr:PspC domain-containing protein [Gaiellaceae bacterium]
MTAMPLTQLHRSTEDRVILGVCGGIAEAIDVDPTLVRLVFALLALAGGAGVVLYFAVHLFIEGKGWIAVVLALVAASVALHSLGLSASAVTGLALIAGGLALIWRRGGSLRPGAPLSFVGLLVVAGGSVILLTRGGSSTSFLAPGAVAGALVLVVGPWLWQLAVERDQERTERIRSEERAEVAARVHDSVLQTLALVQRHADEPKRVASLARRQERELRVWLYGDGHVDGDTLSGALTAAATDVEELHGVLVELATGTDCALSEEQRPIVLAAREAMTNAAKFSGAGEISVYAEARDDQISIFVRDRGVGFDRDAVPGDRRGLAESIEGRMTRAGGTATIVSSPGSGTEVELTLPRVSA